MKYILQYITLTILCLMVTTLEAQEKPVSLINYSPDSNFIVLRVKNSKDLKEIFSNHPLKKIIYSSKTRELIDDMFQAFQDEILEESLEEIEDDDQETKDLTKVVIDKFLATFNGEAILTISNEDFNEESTSDENVNYNMLAHVDQELFKEYLKMNLALEEKSKLKKVISKKEYENVEYNSIVCEYSNETSFEAVFNGIAIISSDEEVFKKMVTAVVKKSTFEKGLKSNDKIFSYLNANQNKEILFTCDLAPIFKGMMEGIDEVNEEETEEADGEEKLIVENEVNKFKMLFEAMQLEKLFLITLSYDHKEKVDNFDFTLNCLDEGVLQYVTFINSEFTPSAFISSDVSAYTRIFFSISELKKKALTLISKIDPEAIKQYQDTLAMAKTNFQFDIEAFIESIGDDTETFSNYKEDREEGLLINKLKNQTNFITNLASIMNSPMIKLYLGGVFDFVENKENTYHFWVLTSKAIEKLTKEIGLAVGTIESYGFISVPGKMAQKQIALIKKDAVSKLSGLAAYHNTRVLFPPKVAIFTFASMKEMYVSLKSKLKKKFATITADSSEESNSELLKINKILDDIKVEEIKGNMGFGLWKDKNKLLLSIKLINK